MVLILALSTFENQEQVSKMLVSIGRLLVTETKLTACPNIFKLASVIVSSVHCPVWIFYHVVLLTNANIIQFVVTIALSQSFLQ